VNVRVSLETLKPAGIGIKMSTSAGAWVNALTCQFGDFLDWIEGLASR
jgi:hypothetical protein